MPRHIVGVLHFLHSCHGCNLLRPQSWKPCRNWEVTNEKLGEITRIFGGKSPDVRGKSAKHLGKITENVTLKMWEVCRQEIGGVHHHGDGRIKNVRDLTNVTWSLAYPPEWRIEPEQWYPGFYTVE